MKIHSDTLTEADLHTALPPAVVAHVMTVGSRKRRRDEIVPKDYESIRDGVWVASDGSTIHKVSPRGLTLYAVRLVGTRRPVWLDTLAEAKQHDTAAS